MEMKIQTGTFASKYYIEQVMALQIEELGLKLISCGDVYLAEPIKTEEYERGMWWWKKTYHKWTWKSLFAFTLHEIEEGEDGLFKLVIRIGADYPADIVDKFLQGVRQRLEGLRQTMEVTLVRWPMRDSETTDEPSSWGGCYYNGYQDIL
jgi:hypothetical protein